MHRSGLAGGSGSHRIIASIAKKLTHIRTGSVAGIINREEYGAAGAFQGAGAGARRALREEGSRASAASVRPRRRDARAAGPAAAPAIAALTCTHAVAKTDQVEVFAGRTVARSEDALLRPQEGM